MSIPNQGRSCRSFHRWEKLFRTLKDLEELSRRRFTFAPPSEIKSTQELFTQDKIQDSTLEDDSTKDITQDSVANEQNSTGKEEENTEKDEQNTEQEKSMEVEAKEGDNNEQSSVESEGLSESEMEAKEASAKRPASPTTRGRVKLRKELEEIRTILKDK